MYVCMYVCMCLFIYFKRLYSVPMYEYSMAYLAKFVCFLKNLFIYFYSVTIVCIFSPPLHPIPASPTSLPHLLGGGGAFSPHPPP